MIIFVSRKAIMMKVVNLLENSEHVQWRTAAESM